MVSKLNDAREYLHTWLDRSRQAADVAPEVQRLADFLDWEARTLERRPQEASCIPTARLDEHANSVYEGITRSLPMIPEVKTIDLSQVQFTVTSSTSAVVEHVSFVSSLQTPEAEQYADTAMTEYRQLQESSQQPTRLRELLEVKLPSLVPRFDVAHDAYEKWRSGHGTAVAAATEMRTFLDGLKGELFERARQHEGENMTVDRALERLFSPSPSINEVREQFSDRPGLYDMLSAILKRRESSAKYVIDIAWSFVLDHGLIVIGAL